MNIFNLTSFGANSIAYTFTCKYTKSQILDSLIKNVFFIVNIKYYKRTKTA